MMTVVLLSRHHTTHISDLYGGSQGHPVLGEKVDSLPRIDSSNKRTQP